MKLLIDPDFQSLIPPLSEEELAGLTRNIQTNGCQDSIKIWNGTIVDGHNRYAICSEHEIEFKTTDMDFGDKDDAKIWIIERQFDRRNLNAYQRGKLALVLKPLIADKAHDNKVESGKTHGVGQEKVSPTLAEPIDTREEVAKAAQVSHGTLSKIEKIEEKATPEQKEQLDAGEVSVNKVYTEIQKIEKKSLVQKSEDGEVLTPQQERMVDKFKRLGELEEQGVYIGSIWSFEKRADYAGDGSFHGNAAPQVVENAVLLFSSKGDTVLDPMAGSGTTLEVCKVLDRECIAMDLTPQRPDILEANASDLPLDDDSVDFIFWHPPYWNMVKYSDDERDLSNVEWPEFLRLCHNVLVECQRVLRLGKKIVILSGDKIQNGNYFPISRMLANNAERIGLIDCGSIVKPGYNTTSQIVKGKTIWAELAYTNNIKVEHDIISVFRK